MDTDKGGNGRESLNPDADAGVRVVAPGDANLFDAIAEALGEGKRFAIEEPAGGGEPGEDIAGGGLAEELEAALGIADASEQERATDRAEDAGEQAARGGLGRIELGFGEVARPDGDVKAAIEPGFEFFEFGEWGGEVSIAHENELARGGDHALADGVTFAVVGIAREEADEQVAGFEGAHEVGRVVSAAIVDDDDLTAALGLFAVVANRRERRPETL